MSNATATRPTAGSAPPAKTGTTAVTAANWEQPTDKKGLESLSPMVVSQLQKALPSFMNSPATAERLVRCLITECQANPRLFECTPISLFACCIRAGQLGLEIGGPLGRAYLIPFRNNRNGGRQEAQLIPGYRGLIELAHRSGMIKRITPVVVRRGDHYEVRRGLKQDLIHVPKRGNVQPSTDYYVVVELTTGGIDFEEMTVEQAIAFRNTYATVRNAPAGVRDNSPWYDIEIDGDKITPGDGFDAMALKTLVRRISKRIPMSAELASAIGMEDDSEAGKIQPVPIVTGDMPNLLGPSVPENDAPTEPAKEKAEELDDKLAEVKAAGGGDPNAPVDFLTPAIDEYKAAGGIPDELADLLGVKMKDIRASTGKDRAKYTDEFNKATKIATETNPKK